MANVIFYTGSSGQSLYVRIQNPAGNYVATALSEGTSGGEGTYYASESTIAGLTGMSSASTGNGCPFRVFVGGTPSTTATDPIAAFGSLKWSGSAELSDNSSLLATTNGSASVGTQLQNLDASVSSAASASHSDADFEKVPDSRTWKLIANSSDELVGDKTRVLDIDSGEKAFAVDFGVDLGTNAYISTVNSVAIDSGAEGGITFGTNGRDHNLAKIRITGVTAGTYVIQVKATDSENGPHTAKVTLKVVE